MSSPPASIVIRIASVDDRSYHDSRETGNRGGESGRVEEERRRDEETCSGAGSRGTESSHTYFRYPGIPRFRYTCERAARELGGVDSNFAVTTSRSGYTVLPPGRPAQDTKNESDGCVCVFFLFSPSTSWFHGVAVG